MIKITFPDNSTREYQEGVTGMDIAKSISNSLAKEVLAVSVNEEIWDVTRPIKTNARIKLHKFDDKEGKLAFWHSSAHLMAEALESLYPGTKFGIGPAIENGFYYDIDPGNGAVITDADLPRIEKKMKELSGQNNSYTRAEISKQDVLKLFKDRVMNTSLSLSMSWKMVPFRFIHKEILLIYAGVRIYLIQVLLRP